MDSKRGKCKLTKEKIVQLYTNGYSTTEIGHQANVSARYINKVLNNLNVERRPHGSWKRKYTLNEDYFKHWSNNMAYVLGFFLADGTVSDQLQSISFSQNDRGILEQISAELDSNHKIYLNEKTNVYTLYVHSKVMKADLIHLHGIKPNKSNTVEFPNVPDEYLSHFIRGYFDGDGHIYRSKYYVCFVGGSKTFMYKLTNILIEHRIGSRVVKIDSHYRVYITGKKSVKRFGEWIYLNKELYLRRKYLQFDL